MSISEEIHRLDVLGLRCPLPVLKARRVAKGLAAGALLEVIADDAASQFDFPHFCETSGHVLLKAEAVETPKGTGGAEGAEAAETAEAAMRFVFLIKIGPSPEAS